jgi:tetratricopeptide (TPR) repeat protein
LYCYGAILADYSGETEGCLERCRQAFEIAERSGTAYTRAVASTYLGLAHLLREEWPEATELLERGLELAHRHQTSLEAEAIWLSFLAEAQLGLGRRSAARQLSDEAIAVARRRCTPVNEIRAQAARARILRQTEGADAAAEIDAALARAQVLIEETGARGYAPFVQEERAKLARLLGDDATRERELREAHRLFVEMGATGHAQRLAKELGL